MVQLKCFSIHSWSNKTFTWEKFLSLAVKWWDSVFLRPESKSLNQLIYYKSNFSNLRWHEDCQRRKRRKHRKRADFIKHLWKRPFSISWAHVHDYLLFNIKILFYCQPWLSNKGGWLPQETHRSSEKLVRVKRALQGAFIQQVMFACSKNNSAKSFEKGL